MAISSQSGSIVALLAAGIFCPLSATANTPTGAGSEKKFVVGVTHVIPPYQAGAKFRTPENVETALAEDAARRLGATLFTRAASPNDSMQLLVSRQANAVIAAIPEGDPLLSKENVIRTGYSAGPMAIMRTDTNIKTWDQLKGRTVCVAEGSPYKGMATARYGAVEKLFPAPADSLLALRIGHCDAALHDSTMLEQLLRLPEWKKFSARLPVGSRSVLAFVTPENDKAMARSLREVSNQWTSSRQLEMLNEKRVKHIAFEVYLDQNVPDCH